jgi:hypothetical protein
LTRIGTALPARTTRPAQNSTVSGAEDFENPSKPALPPIATISAMKAIVESGPAAKVSQNLDRSQREDSLPT